jgi:FtsP/CotA-like multicopper oxidase with cupredoxin domain
VSEFKSRRRFLQDSTAITAGLLAAGAANRALADAPDDQTTPPHVHEHTLHQSVQDHMHMERAAGYVPIDVPDVPKLPYTMDGRVKVFHLVCEPVKRSFVPGWTFDLWGYNGSAPGPTIEAVEGDRVRLHVTNKLPELTSMHWHGLELPLEMDGCQASAKIRSCREQHTPTNST